MQSLKVLCIEATKCTRYPSDVFDKVVKMIALFHRYCDSFMCHFTGGVLQQERHIITLD